MEILALFFSGCIIGVLGTFFGIGGGVITIPLLTVLFNYPIHDAVATSLIIVVANSIAASSKNLASGYANLKIGLIIALFSLIGSMAGGFISIGVSGKVLFITLGAAQVLTAVIMLNKKRLPSPIDGKSEPAFKSEYYEQGKKIVYSVYHVLPTTVISVLNGILSGMVGIGGGVIIVPTMNLVMGVPIKVATATSALIMGFTAAGGGLIFFLNGYARVDAVALMVPGIFLSSQIAGKYFARVSSEKLYKAFIIFLIIIAISMFYKGFYGNN